MAKDMLFATLDPTMRSVHLSNGTDIILSDTVGFISDLPTELVASFRATLEEVLAADLICHVRDIAHPQSDEQAEDVRKILETLGVGEGVPVIEVWNKSDLLDPDARDSLAEVAARRDEVQVISSIDGSGIEALVEAISERIKPAVSRERVFLGWKDAKRRAWLFEKSLVLEERSDNSGAYFLVEWTPVQKATFQAMA
jgi:GTP-binding protein HflX